MKLAYANGATSAIVRVKILDSTSTTGAGKTGLTHSSSGLIISTIASNESTATTYTAAASNVETITTLGTFAAPTSGKCRFKEVDATNHPGLYEIQFADARFSVSNARHLIGTVQVTGGVQVDFEIQLENVPTDVKKWLGTAVTLTGTLPNVNVHAMTDETVTESVFAADAIALVQDVQTWDGTSVSNAGGLPSVSVGRIEDAVVTTIQSGLATSSALSTVGTNVSTLLSRIPSALFSGITSLANWLGALAGKTADTTTRTEINATTAGATYNETTDSGEAIRDRGDAAWTGGGAGGEANLTQVNGQPVTIDQLQFNVLSPVINGLVVLHTESYYNEDRDNRLPFTNSSLIDDTPDSVLLNLKYSPSAPSLTPAMLISNLVGEFDDTTGTAYFSIDPTADYEQDPVVSDQYRYTVTFVYGTQKVTRFEGRGVMKDSLT